MKKLFANAVARVILVFVGVTLVTALTYGLLPVHILGDELSMTLALRVVSCVLVLPGLLRRRPGLLGVFSVHPLGTEAADMRMCRLWAVTGLVVLALLVLIEHGNPVAAATAPVGVLLEELIFRGLPLVLLMRVPSSKRTTWAVILISSLTFAALHYSPLQIMYLDRSIFSLLALLLAIKFKSLWPAVLYHALANIAAVATADLLYDPGYAWLYIPLDIVIFALVFLSSSKSSTRQTSKIGPVKVT